MNIINILLFLFAYVFSINASSDFYGYKVKLLKQSGFEAPIDTHLIDTLMNIRSLIQCITTCEQNIICRTADYDSMDKTCRLFETLASTGTVVDDPTKTVIVFNYCTNDQQQEPEYVCTRTGTYTVQQMFDQLALAPGITLSDTDRGAYANMYGVYTSSNSGYLSFFTYDGSQIILQQRSSEITNVNSATNSELGVIQYYRSLAIIYKNIGTSFQPQLIPTLNISLFSNPYSCLVTTQYIYITYTGNTVVMTIHDLSSGLTLFTIQNNGSSYRPVVSQWIDTIVIIDQYQVMEYTLNGTFKGYWPYFTGPQASVRHYIDHDYAGRRYTCNSGGSKPGIYAFLMDGTQLATGPSSCFRAFQVYITKEQAMLINIPGSATMNVINF